MPCAPPDEWDHRTAASTTLSRGSPLKHASKILDSGLSRASSAPLLWHATSPPIASTWHASGSLQSPPKRPSWTPLGATWRDWKFDSDKVSRVSTCPDDGKEFLQGCVPHWGKSSLMRMRGVLEHELTWAYYRMRRHEKHPQRKEVGETLPPAALSEKMRFGKCSVFQFWRDLRPPFAVIEARRVDERQGGHGMMKKVNHPDGELYSVKYDCAIEYFAERLMDDKSPASTFDSKIRGVATVRIPDKFPQQRPLHIVSWGQPTLNLTPDSVGPPTKAVPPELWMPIAAELGLDARSERLAACATASREAANRADKKKKVVKVPSLQKLLLGPHAALPRLEAATAAAAKVAGALMEVGEAEEKAATPAKVRKHTIYTPAAGFVSYSG